MIKETDFETMEVFGSRDVEERLQELLSEEELEEEEQEELKELQELKEECEHYGWEYGITFIRETYFKDYAREIFDETNEVSDNLRSYIDYESFADDLEMDYSEVEFRGITYYWREA